MKGLAELEIPVISDEIYADLSYEDSPNSFLSFSDNTIAIHGFSKYYAMTGWRLGYMITPLNGCLRGTSASKLDDFSK